MGREANHKCPTEGSRTYYSLYMQFREAGRTMKKVGAYCISCKSFALRDGLGTDLLS